VRLVRFDRRLVRQNLVEFLLVVFDRVLICEDGGLVGGDSVQLRLVPLDRDLVREDLFLVGDDDHVFSKGRHEKNSWDGVYAGCAENLRALPTIDKATPAPTA